MKGLDRDMLLLSKKRTKTTPLEQVPLIVDYHSSLPPLKSNLAKHSPILNVYRDLNEHEQSSPFNTSPPT